MTASDRKNRITGFLLTLAAALVIMLVPMEGLSREGRICFCFTICAVILWMFKVVDPSFVAGLYVIGFLILKVADPKDIFFAWVDGTTWLVMGSFLIARAVIDSGICKRFTYIFVLRFVRSFKHLIVSIYILSAMLALIIPNPWPRCLILIGVVKDICDEAGMSRHDRATAGIAVFAASIPTCFLYLTGAAAMNQIVMGFSGIYLSWMEWLKMMFVPGAVMTAVYCILNIAVYPADGGFSINTETMKNHLDSLGHLTKREKVTIIWLTAAIVIWLTDGIHGIKAAWATFGIAMLMPFQGRSAILNKQSWTAVPVDILIYQTAAVAIGRVGSVTGMTKWISDTFLVFNLPGNILLLGLLICAVCMFMHIFLGSTISVNSVLIPSFIVCTAATRLTPICCALLCYMAIFSQYIFPYQHINILMGIGETGMYEQSDSIKMALPLTVCVPIVICLVEIPWWILIGAL